MEFLLRDTLLHLDDLCLYRSPVEHTATTLECLGALVRHSIVSAVDSEGFCNRCPTSTLTPLDAICLLTSRGYEVRINGDETIHCIPVHAPWSVSSLVSLPETMVSCNESVHPAEYNDGYTITISPRIVDVPLQLTETLFQTVVNSSSYVLRVSHNPQGPSRIVRYLDRILVGVEPLTTFCGSLTIDERGCFDQYEGGVSETSLSYITSVLLRTETIPIVSESRICHLLLTKLSKRWGHVMRSSWGSATCDTLLKLLRSPDTPDCVALCIDPAILWNQCLPNERMNVLGMTIVRRLSCADATRYADMRSSLMTHHGVARFDLVPISKDRFEHLHSIGMFEGMCACRHAVVLGDDVRVVCVPFHTRTEDIVQAITTLLAPSVDLSGERPTLTYSFGIIYQESSSQCPVEETLLAYKMYADAATKTIRLEEDADVQFKVDDVLSVDELERLTIPCHESRVRRVDVALLFPEMAKRVELKSSDDRSACLREIQSRRVAREWTLDAIDAGQNMSGMGLTLLLHTLLSQWLGAKCRVAQSRCGSAMLAVYMDNGYRLVDPCRTLCNFFTLSREVSQTVQCSSIPAHGMVVEVRKETQWNVGVITSLEVERGIMIVQTANGNREVVSIGSHGWRRVGSDVSDTDRVLKSLLLQHRKRPRP